MQKCSLKRSLRLATRVAFFLREKKANYSCAKKITWNEHDYGKFCKSRRNEIMSQNLTYFAKAITLRSGFDEKLCIFVYQILG